MRNLLRSGQFRKRSTHLQVRLRFSEAAEHLNLRACYPSEALVWVRAQSTRREIAPQGSQACRCIKVEQRWPALRSTTPSSRTASNPAVHRCGLMLFPRGVGRTRRDRNFLSSSASLARGGRADAGPGMGSHAPGGPRYGRIRRLGERAPEHHASNPGPPSVRRLNEHTLHGRPSRNGVRRWRGGSPRPADRGETALRSSQDAGESRRLRSADLHL